MKQVRFTIQIKNADGLCLAETQGSGRLDLVYRQAYRPGDWLELKADQPGYCQVQLEDSLPPVTGYLKGPFTLVVPFGEKLSGYSPKCFSGDLHLLQVRAAWPEEVKAYRNLAFNPLDSHDNDGLFPHVFANVETRGEAQFAARNAINGNAASESHGSYPYESWGINRREDAALTIDFGCAASLDQARLTLRADFPHDNYWQQAQLSFSDGSRELLKLQKSGQPQTFALKPRTVTWARLEQLLKDPADPSPFPALTQLELWGTPAL
ncbi:MAG: carbohydrate-binding protein [Oscillospiraceae bacterium]|nr:carbohydrate-binding protein [Oscillospiraceae bacterium]